MRLDSVQARAAAFAMSLASVAVPAAAQQAYRCTDAEGRVTYQERPCPAAAAERKVDTTPANTDFDPAQRERLLKQGEEAQRRLEERIASEEAERQRQRERREKEAQQEREALAREEARETAVIVYGPGRQPIVVPPRPKPRPKPLPAPAARPPAPATR
ncbi:MAG: DUF4124 domain-containing protein [Betaproteobacteria bacterium]|nr:DUF4124 domain-containing protein [Betaproteobacteria bacterium]